MKHQKLLFKSLIVSIVFTLLDYIVHYSYDYLTITSTGYYGLSPLVSYALGKLIGSFIILSILFFTLEKLNFSDNKNNFIKTIIITLLLELRYLFIYNYTVNWHLVNFINHFILLYLTLYGASKWLE